MEFGSWVSDIVRLQDALRRKNRQRPDGGRIALSGLIYQAHVAILDAVREATAGPDAPPVSLLYESLSDYTIARGDATYVTCQVKRTLRADNKELLAALNELHDVYLTAQDSAPDILPRLRFRISYLRSDVKDPMDRARVWAAHREDPESANAVVEALDITAESDPLGELLSILAEVYRIPKPQELIDHWIGLILAEASGRSALADDIANSLTPAVTTDDRPFVVLSADDREPDAVIERDSGFLVGEQPTFTNLREGFFAPNPNVEELENRFWHWYEGVAIDPAAAASGRVPMYWIEGPSGSGKSILLLQLLARLNARSAVTVLWLDNVEALPDAVRFAKPLAHTRRVVIGMDDPFMINLGEGATTWRSAMSQLAVLRQRGRVESLPIFVCCGPSEQLSRFQDYYSSDVTLNSHVHSIPSAADIARMQDWYRSRTGDHRELPSTEAHMLPAQLFFEWWKRQGITDFARRFRGRMRQLGMPSLVEFVDRVLALNRLYLGYPTTAIDSLEEHARDGLAVLESDLHFTERKTGRRGYWLSHPHLSDILYRTWHPPTSAANVRTGHVRQALLDAVNADTDGTAQAKLILAFVALLHPDEAADEPERRISSREVGSALKRAADVVGPQSDALGLPALAAWVRVQSVAPDCTDSWNPRQVALRQLTDETLSQCGLDGLLMALVDSGHHATLIAVRDFVAQRPSWKLWAPIMLRLLEDGSVSDLSPHIVCGVLVNPADQERLGLLRAAMRAAPLDEQLRTAARGLLDDPDIVGAKLGDLAAEMITAASSDRDVAISWLTRAVRRENGAALAAVLLRPKVPLLVADSATKWLIKYPEDQPAGTIFPALLRWQKVGDRRFLAALRRHLSGTVTPASPEVVEAVGKLLSQRPSNPSWTYLFDALTDLQRSEPAIQEAGRMWLRENTDRAGWSGVLVLMAQAVSGEDAELTRAATAYLPRVEDSETWAVIMLRLYGLCQDDERRRFVEKSRDWLEGHPSSVLGWGYLFRQTLQCAAEDQTIPLLELAMTWLREHKDSDQWSHVWRATLAGTPKADHGPLLESAADWLGAERVGWAYVFKDFFGTDWGQARGIEFGVPWLTSHKEHDRWPTVFATLMPLLHRDEVATLFASWLDEADSGDSEVGFLWKAVIEDGPYSDLANHPVFHDSVVQWLRKHHAARTWWHVWSWLHAFDPASMEIIEIAVTTPMGRQRCHALGNRLGKTARENSAVAPNVWRALATYQHGAAWIHIWHDVGKVDPGAEFWALGLEWLDKNPDSDSFAFTWKALWDSFPGTSELDTLEPIGLRWCLGNEEHLSWAGVWLRLMKHHSPANTETIIEMAKEWLHNLAVSGPSKHRDAVAAVIYPMAPTGDS